MYFFLRLSSGQHSSIHFVVFRKIKREGFFLFFFISFTRDLNLREKWSEFRIVWTHQKREVERREETTNSLLLPLFIFFNNQFQKPVTILVVAHWALQVLWQWPLRFSVLSSIFTDIYLFIAFYGSLLKYDFLRDVSPDYHWQLHLSLS